MNPVISIIVPIYKAEQCLPRCIDSILAQTFTDFELLLIDDGSPDNSGRICDEYARKDARISVFHKENSGASSARNMGLSNAKGKYICFADADDYADKSWLSIYLSDEEIADLTIQSFYECDDSGMKMLKNEKEGIYSLTDFEEILLDLEEKGFGYLWCKMFKSEIIKDNNLLFNTKFRLCEDLEFIYRYLQYVTSIRIKSEGAYHYQLTVNAEKKYEGGIHAECYLSIYHCSQAIMSTPKVMHYMKARSAKCAAYDIIRAYLNKEYRYAYKYLSIYSTEIKDLSEIRFYLIESRLFKCFYQHNNIRLSHRIYCLIYSSIRLTKRLLKRHS